MMAVNVYHACIVGIFTTRLRRLFVCGPRRAKNNSSRAAFRCAMARERDRAPQIRTTGDHYYRIKFNILQLCDYVSKVAGAGDGFNLWLINLPKIPLLIHICQENDSDNVKTTFYSLSFVFV